MSTTTELASPTWDVARLFPPQGAWSDDDYLALATNNLIELSDGSLEVLPMPTFSHQRIVFWLSQRLEAFARGHGGGVVVPVPYRVRLWSGKYREPDVCYVQPQHKHRITAQFSDGADLVVEVVSDDDRRRDLVVKRAEYAKASIPEYWIVDPQNLSVTVLALDGTEYAEHGQFICGQNVTSRLLMNLTVAVDDLFAAGELAT